MIVGNLTINPERVTFNFNGSSVIKVVFKGLDYIISNFELLTPLSGYDFEFMVCRAEELVQKNLDMNPLRGEVFANSSYLIKELSDSYFSNAEFVTNEDLNRFFQIMAETSSYDSFYLNQKQLYLLALLIFFREVSQCLDVRVLHLL